MTIGTAVGVESTPIAVDVVILGAGINGAALARELVLNGLSVVVVDADDIAAGTTRWSTRLGWRRCRRTWPTPWRAVRAC